MGFRSKARECAFQMLYQWDQTGDPISRVMGRFWKLRASTDRTRALADGLARGAQERLPEIDAVITRHLQNWRFERLAPIDKTVLRLGVHELMNVPQTPGKTVIDEMVEVAKRFGEADSPSFVNGVLDAVYHEVRSEATAEGPRSKRRRER
ncbi:MAG: transcription antitermination factor NusB [Vicinamibacteria bacterium]|nr:transcription antitermination factor NusB [Vicinamibacteria bacterium]